MPTANEILSKGAIEGIVRATYEARNRGDVAAMANSFAPDAVFQIAGNPSLCSIAKTTKGRDAIVEEFSRLLRFEFERQEVLSVAVDGNAVFVHGILDVKYKPTGKRATFYVIDYITMKDGQIASLMQFTDTAAISEMMR